MSHASLITRITRRIAPLALTATTLLGGCKAAPKNHVSGQLPSGNYHFIVESNVMLNQSICGARSADGTLIPTAPNNPLLATELTVNGQKRTLANVVAEHIILESDHRADFLALAPSAKQTAAINDIAGKIASNGTLLAKLSPDSLNLLTRYCETGGNASPTGLIPNLDMGITDEMIKNAINPGTPATASTAAPASTASSVLGLRVCDANFPCSTNNITPGQTITVTLVLNGKDLPINISDYVLNLGNRGLSGVIKTIENHDANYTVPGTGRNMAADGTVFTIDFTATPGVQEPLNRTLKLYVKHANNQIQVANEDNYLRINRPSRPVVAATVTPPVVTVPPVATTPPTKTPSFCDRNPSDSKCNF
ncbi:MAG: hypothetical protein KKC80_01105 [Candidatus Margulisbacteria bacterium]|nr:hypothetical protein [Candidatus Margulisiibacteriota bacterium]